MINYQIYNQFLIKFKVISPAFIEHFYDLKLIERKKTNIPFVSLQENILVYFKISIFICYMTLECVNNYLIKSYPLLTKIGLLKSYPARYSLYSLRAANFVFFLIQKLRIYTRNSERKTYLMSDFQNYKVKIPHSQFPACFWNFSLKQEQKLPTL